MHSSLSGGAVTGWKRSSRATFCAVIAATGVLAVLVSPRAVHSQRLPAVRPSGSAIINSVLAHQLDHARQRRRFFSNRQPVPLVRLEITSTRDVSRTVRALGGTVDADIGGNLTVATMPADRVVTLARQPGVRGLFPSLRLHRSLDRSVPEIRANQVWNTSDHHGLPIRGQHVLVGVVDSGIDYHNPDFKNPDGSTRIKYLWDQTQNGNPPSGLTFGYECNSASINSGQCPERGTDPHGTHVAGTAAGNGRSSNPAREIGVAPQADILFVKSDFDTNRVIAAWKWLVDKARQLNEPLVVNNSFGGQLSPHDGTDPDALAVDALSGPGRVFVAAAGNEGNKGLHASGSVASGGKSEIGLTAGGGSQELTFALFYPVKDDVTATLTNVDTGETIGPVPDGGHVDQKLSRDGETKITVDARPWDGDHHSIYVDINHSSANSPLSHSWRLSISGARVTDNGRYDAWIDNGGAFTQPDESDTVGDPAVAHSMIAVGNYATRLDWTGQDGQQHSACDIYLCANGTLALGDIKASSSRGPTRDGRQKPDIAAPGTMIISSLSRDAPVCRGGATDNCADPGFITPDGKNYAESGTSMSAPHVAGVVALMLQANPNLSAADVDQILRRTARHDQFTGSAAWTPSFGAGKVDALAAVQAALEAAGTPTPRPTTTPRPTSRLTFSLLSVRAETKGSKASLAHPALTHVRTGTQITLSIYARFKSVPDNARLIIEWNIKRNGQIAGYNSRVETLNHKDVGNLRFHWLYAPRVAGTYILVGRITVNGQVREGSAAFSARR